MPLIIIFKDKVLIFFDLGSNTVRAVAYDCKNSQKVGEFETITRTAEKAFSTGIINEDAAKRVIKAIKDAKNKLNFGESVGVATAVYRQSSNGASLIARIFEETGVVVKIIDGETEAWLAATAVTRYLPSKTNFILVDIGGASTEIIVNSQDGMIVESFDFGIIRITEQYKNHDDIIHAVTKEMEPVREFLKDCTHGFAKPELFCATSGTPATIAALSLGMTYNNYDPDEVNGTIVSHEETKKQMKKLLTLSSNEREKIVGVGRQDLIIAGCAIFEQMYSATGFFECKVFEDGIREGLAVAYCNKLIDFGD